MPENLWKQLWEGWLHLQSKRNNRLQFLKEGGKLSRILCWHLYMELPHTSLEFLKKKLLGFLGHRNLTKEPKKANTQWSCSRSKLAVCTALGSCLCCPELWSELRVVALLLCLSLESFSIGGRLRSNAFVPGVPVIKAPQGLCEAANIHMVDSGSPGTTAKSKIRDLQHSTGEICSLNWD